MPGRAGAAGWPLQSSGIRRSHILERICLWGVDDRRARLGGSHGGSGSPKAASSSPMCLGYMLGLVNGPCVVKDMVYVIRG
jgi:hypothetical protein